MIQIRKKPTIACLFFLVFLPAWAPATEVPPPVVVVKPPEDRGTREHRDDRRGASQSPELTREVGMRLGDRRGADRARCGSGNRRHARLD